MTADSMTSVSEHVMSEEELVARIAWFYYHDSMTQSDISTRMGLSRLKVSRLLEKGRQSGIIRIQINSRFEGCLKYEEALRGLYSLHSVRVLPVMPDVNASTRLGTGAAQMLMEYLQPQQLLAIGFGEAAMTTLKRLSGFISAQEIRLVTLSGGVGPYMTGIGQLDAACSVSIVPAPLRASSPEIAQTLRNENSVRDVMMTAQAADVAIVGVGAVSQKEDATISRTGYVTSGEQLMLGRKGAVGDILGFFFDAQGELIPDIKIHQELIGLSLASFMTIPIRIGVAGGVEKSEAIVAAMNGGYINALVTDETTAEKMLLLSGRNQSR